MTLLLEVRRGRNSTGLPAGPSEPAAAQTLEWALRPTALLRRCARRHGEAFTLRLTFDDAPMVCVWSPQGVADVLAAPAGVLRRGESPGPLRPVAGPRSILLADGAEHLRMRRLMLPPFHGERLRALGDVVAARAGTAVERWPAGRPVALLGALQRLALDVALEVVLGADGAAPGRPGAGDARPGRPAARAWRRWRSSRATSARGRPGARSCATCAPSTRRWAP